MLRDLTKTRLFWLGQAGCILVWFLLLLSGRSVLAMTAKCWLKGTGARFVTCKELAAAGVVGDENICRTSSVANVVFVPIAKTPRPDQFDSYVFRERWLAGDGCATHIVKFPLLTCVNWESHKTRVLDTILASAVVDYRPIIDMWIARLFERHQFGETCCHAFKYAGSVGIPDVFEPYDRLRKLCRNLRAALGKVLRQVALDGSGNLHWTAEYYVGSVRSMKLFSGVTIEQPGTDDSAQNNSDNRPHSNCCGDGYFWLKRPFPQTGWWRWLGIAIAFTTLPFFGLTYMWFFHKPTPFRLLTLGVFLSIATSVFAYGLVLFLN